MNLQEFLVAMEEGGVWCVVEPLAIIQKYLRSKDNITVVSLPSPFLENEIFAGIVTFSADDVKFTQENGEIRIDADYFTHTTELKALDYIIKMGYDYSISPRFRSKLLASGYVSRFEYKKFNQPGIIEHLPKVKTINLRRYVPQCQSPNSCNWCHCPQEEHIHWSCPLLDNKLICEICCHHDIQAYDGNLKQLEIVEVVRKVTGRELKEGQIAKVCRKCGHNHGVLNEYLSQ